MFESGVKSTNGAVQTTTIAGDKLMQNLAKGGYKVLPKGGAFLTDVAAFTALEVVTDGQDIATAGKEQLEFLPKLKIMNSIIEYMLGGRVHAGMVKAKMDAAIEQSGVKNWTIKEIKTPTKTMYEVEIAEGMPKAHFANSNDLATAMAEVIAGKYEKLNAAKGETSKPDASTKQKADKTPHPNPLPQEASEQSGVRAIDAKYLQKVNDEITKLVDKYKDDFYWLKAKDITENFDYTNADRHLRNLDILLKNNSNRLSGIMKLGYFSSKDGANALEWIIQNYSFKSSGNRVSEADHIASALTPTEVLRAINRNITDNENIIGLAQLNDIEYDRWQTSPYKGKLMFVSSNDNVNKFFLSLDKKYVEYLKTIDKYILEDIAKAPKDEKDILNFYEHLLNSLNNDTWEFCEVLKGENLPAYKKAYEYLKEHNIGNAKIALVDSSKDNIYSNENIYNMFKGKTADDWNIVFFDEQGNFIRADVANKIESHKTENIKTDTRNIEFQTETKKNAKSKRDILINSVKKIRDNNGKLLYTERYEASYDIANKFNIIREYPDGKKYKIGLAEVSNAGDIIIEKSLVSETGVKTDYNYLETPNGSILSNTRITDKNGNVIFNNNYQYKVIDNNHYSTVENGVKYDIQFKENEVTVTRDDGKTVSISLGNNSVDSSNAVLSKDLLPILKKMPASFYFDIKEYGLKKIGLEMEDNAYYTTLDNHIAISKGCSDSNFILAHEFGHYRDNFLKISSDPDVINTYIKEHKALVENQSQFEAFQLKYFIDSFEEKTNQINKSIGEITAEINAFLYASNIKPVIELRGQYLQQYFPETFAKIADKLTNRNKGKVEITMNNSIATSHVYNAQEPVKKYVKPETNVDLTPEGIVRNTITKQSSLQDVNNNNIKEKFKEKLVEIGVDDIEEQTLLTNFLLDASNIIDRNTQINITNAQLEFLKSKGATFENTYLLAPQPSGPKKLKSYTNATRALLEISNNENSILPLNINNTKCEIGDFQRTLFKQNEQGKKFIVLTDDCSLSGASMLEDSLTKLNSGTNLKTGQNVEIVFVPTVLGTKAVHTINNFIKCYEQLTSSDVVMLEKAIKKKNTENLSPTALQMYHIIEEITDFNSKTSEKDKSSTIAKTIKNAIKTKEKGGNISFSLANVSETYPVQLAQDFRNTLYYQNLSNEKKDIISSWLTADGQSFGYHSSATSVIIEGFDCKYDFMQKIDNKDTQRALGYKEDGTPHNIPLKGNAPNNNVILTQILAEVMGIDKKRIKASGETFPEIQYKLKQHGLTSIVNQKYQNGMVTSGRAIKIEFAIKPGGNYDGKISILGKTFDSGCKIEVLNKEGTTLFSQQLPNIQPGTSFLEAIPQIRKELNLNNFEDNKATIVHGTKIIDEKYDKPLQYYPGEQENYIIAIPKLESNNIIVKVNGEIIDF